MTDDTVMMWLYGILGGMLLASACAAGVMIYSMYQGETRAWPNWFWNLNWKWARFKIKCCAWFNARQKGFQLPTVTHLSPIPPGDNPVHHDSGNMYTELTQGWMVFHPGYNRRAGYYVILANQETGQRVRLDFNS